MRLLPVPSKNLLDGLRGGVFVPLAHLRAKLGELVIEPLLGGLDRRHQLCELVARDGNRRLMVTGSGHHAGIRDGTVRIAATKKKLGTIQIVAASAQARNDFTSYVAGGISTATYHVMQRHTYFRERIFCLIP